MNMELKCEYLEDRHRYWKDRIGDAGIWNADKFRPVKFIVRKRSKTYDGFFCRKRVVVGSKCGWEDKIIIYQQYTDITTREIDDTLVHEMIHQYIFQNDLKDSRTHGSTFKDFMCKINRAFQGELTLMVSGGNMERRGPGNILHKLIIVHRENGSNLCCKVNPNKADMFMSLIREHKDEWKVRKYELCESNDMYFDSLTTCTRRLHGVRMDEAELVVFSDECKIRILKKLN